MFKIDIKSTHRTFDSSICLLRVLVFQKAFAADAKVVAWNKDYVAWVVQANKTMRPHFISSHSRHSVDVHF